MALDGSPRQSEPILSISSIMNTGLLLPGVADGADDGARHGADVGAPVPADLGLVAHAAHADADELAAHRPGDALAQAGLAHARRPDEAEDGAGDLGLELLDGQELEDAVLDVFQVVVVLVEHLAAVRDVQVVGGEDRPGQRHDPVEVGADDAVLGGGRGQLRQPVELAAGLLVHLLGQVGLLDAARAAR